MTRSKSIKTVEQELDYMNKLWSKMDTLEKVVVLTITFMFFYFIIVVLASYNKLSKSAEPTAGKASFWLIIITTIIVVLPIVAHYFGISTFGVIHVIGLAGVITFIAALWTIFESFDKRELDTNAYKDPYSIAIYFLLVSFSVLYIVGTISRKL